MTKQSSFLSSLARYGVMLATVAALAACGGGGGSSSNSASTNSAPSSSSNASNQVGVTVAAGVAGVINQPNVSVTVCQPGTSNCQVINNVLLDTGSYGLRLLASSASSVLGSLPTATAANGGVLAECGQFVSTYTWGTVRTADVHLAGEVASSLPIQIIADTSLPTAPSACSSNGGTEVSTAQALGANGILGVGTAIADCGTSCTNTLLESSSASSGLGSTYYGCQSGSCSLVAVPQSQQVQNVAANFATDNNGMILTLGNPSGGVATGTLTFGINTQSDNALATTTPRLSTGSTGDLTAALSGSSYSTAFFDTGSNGLYFNAPSGVSLPTCSSDTNFYCPTSTQTLTGTATGQNGVQKGITLTIENATNTLFSTGGYALADLGGPFGTSGVLDFGLPFFFGRTTYFGFDLTASTGAAPYVTF